MKAILTGGGTGGHIYPAVSIAREIQRRYKNVEIIFVGTEKGLESKIIPKEGFVLKTIKVRGFERKFTLKNLVAVKEAAFSIGSARKIIKDFKPDIVIGTGGYVCGTVMLTAALMGIPTVIHESNAFAGMTNKLLFRFVDKIALNFEEAAKYFRNSRKVVVTGNPIRPELLQATRQEGRHELGFDENAPLVFITGGSRGARKINQSILALAEECSKSGQYQLLHMTGDTQYKAVLQSYKDRKIPTDSSNIKVVPYLYNMPYALAASDIIISRCGAMTLSEITALGKPSVLIPFPYAADNHQEYNARALEKKGAAIVIVEKDLTEERLKNTVLELLNHKEKLEQTALNSKKLGVRNATEKIGELISELLGSKK
ncbi:MAG TPA: undecaprenyldiphospho-muramoylpentapeptide beta-N-acetylglucosaminyltransferase [Patescibacteria group bacterium]|nr:undecaprenyldiphospho-muramoylpentapeptide beta-N-acetylglucosaminyltransferase [Patescibacteria group bacterium]